MRCCDVIEKATETGRVAEANKTREEKKAEEEARDKDRKQRFDGLSIPEIEEENKQSITDLYRLIKKYLNLRKTVSTLKVRKIDCSR